MSSSSSAERAHPLADRLVAAAAAGSFTDPVVEVGNGSGRNTRALVGAGIRVVAVGDSTPYTQLPGEREAYGAALSTHAYLHGTDAKLRAGMAELRRVLRPGAPAFMTLGSFRDARYGLGLALDERTFAPGDGDEAGVPHVYYDRDGVLELMRGFTIDALDEVDADDTVGRWAHADDGVRGRVQWWIQARRD